MNANEYEKILLPERLKFKLKEINFLNDNFFLQGMKRSIFESKYYFEFSYCEFNRDKLIIKENEKPQYLYFIKDGEIEISLNTSLIQLIKKLEKLSKAANLTEFKEKLEHKFTNINSNFYVLLLI